MFSRTLTKRNSYAIVVPFIMAWLFFFVVSTPAAHAATLTFSPVTAAVQAGNIVSVKVLVNTDGADINTALATIQFPPDLLQVMSIDQSSSIFSLWAQNPTFSNSAGVVTFTGGLPTPGFAGQNGQIISIIFRALKAGSASLIYSNASVLQNDGLGTDVLDATQSGTIVIKSTSQSQPTSPSVSNNLPPVPVITSTTDPKQNAWYSNTSAEFGWTIPNGVTSLETILSTNPNATPTQIYDNSVSQRTVDGIADGVWYFNLRYMNTNGWGPAASYKVQIDSTPPQNFALNVETQNTQNIVTLNAVDAMSGIDHYSIQIDNQTPFNVAESSLPSNGQYVLPTQNEGEHNLVVTAYDKAGNSTQSNAQFTSPAIIAPVLGTIPTPINRGDSLTIAGSSQYPNSSITAFIQSEGKSAVPYSATTSADGSFSITIGQIENDGPADVWAQLIFSNTIESPISNKQIVTVNDVFIVQTSKSLIYMLSYAIPATLLLLALLFALYIGWHKFFGLKRRLNKEVQQTVNETHRALMIFKDELNRQLKLLEKTKADRELNRKEEKIFKELQDNIDDIDSFISKNLKKIK